jgi:hypothetical protein
LASIPASTAQRAARSRRQTQTRWTRLDGEPLSPPSRGALVRAGPGKAAGLIKARNLSIPPLGSGTARAYRACERPRRRIQAGDARITANRAVFARGGPSIADCSVLNRTSRPPHGTLAVWNDFFALSSSGESAETHAIHDDSRARLLSLERPMSQLNGDKARFQKDRKRRMLRRQRIEMMVSASRAHQLPSAALPLGGRRRKAAVKSAIS